MKKRVLISLLALALVLGSVCVLFATGVFAPEAEALSSTSSKLYVAKNEAAGLYGDVVLIGSGSNYTLYLPGSADAGKLCFSWASSTTVKSGSTVLTSGKAPVAAPGSTVTYTVGTATWRITTVQGSAGVEAMFLETDTSLSGFYSFAAMNGDANKEKEAAGTMSLGSDTGYYFSIKGRGNSTWTAGYSKKPYNITIYKDSTYDKKLSAELIDGVKAKKWSLLANYSDTSLLRNKLGYDMAVDLGIGLESKFVDLWVDGEYLGNYLMTPKSDYAAPEDGYVLEIDNYIDSEDPQFTLEGMNEYHSSWYGYQNRITVKDNEAKVPTAEIEAYMEKAWAALLDEDSDDYLNYIDLDSWAKYYLLHEYYKSFDVVCGSILMHRDGTGADDKLIAGPVWDLDNALGRTTNNRDLNISADAQHSPDGWYIQSVSDDVVTHFWLQQLGRHESFLARVYEIYHEYDSVFNGSAAHVDSLANGISKSAAMNCDLYGVVSGTANVSSAHSHGCVVTSTWNDYVKNLKNYAAKRAAFLAENVPASLSGTVTVTGQVKAGQTLVATATGASGNLTYTWTCGSRTVTGRNFSVRSSDIGKDITVTVTSSSVGGSISATLKAVKVTFDNAGATSGAVSSSYVYTGSTYGSLPNPTRTGYTFAGWYTGANGTGAKVTASTAVTNAAAHTLYASWTKNAAADPTEPSTEATEPGTDTTEPSTETTQPGTDVTEPSTEATDPSTDATEPSTDVTDPSTDATEPSTEATEPSTGTTQPSTQATEPSADATQPTGPTEPGEKDPGKGLNPLIILLPAVAIAAIGLLLLLLKKRKKKDDA